MPATTPEIEHVIVLMLENRSFDHMLGFLDHSDPNYDGLTEGQYPNKYSSTSAPLGVRKVTDHDVKSPGHDHLDVMQQLYGQGDFDTKVWRSPPPVDGAQWPPAPCEGFARSYGFKHGEDRAGDAMKCRAPEGNPVLAMLAKEYAVCTRWFSSVPGATWPNRDYVIAGTSRGEVDIDVLGGLHPIAHTVFRAIKRAKRRWKVYHKDTPHTIVYSPLARYFSRRFQSHSRLLSHIRDYPKKRSLPNFAWVEPDYGLGGGRGNSQHPGQAGSLNEFRAGEVLIAEIYNALVTSHEQAADKSESLFAKTLFVVTYDEHGGFFDHVPPPNTISPDDKPYRSRGYEFDFDLLGARVPAVVVNPWIRRGLIEETTFDHSSIPATLRELFGIEPLAKRDAVANPFWRKNDAAWRQRFLDADVRGSVPRAEPLPFADEKRATRGGLKEVTGVHAGRRIAPDERNDLQELHAQLEDVLLESVAQDAVLPKTTGLRRSRGAEQVSVMDLVKGQSPRTVDVIAEDGSANVFSPEDPDRIEPNFAAYWRQGETEMIDDEDWSLTLDPETGTAILSTPDGTAVTGACDEERARELFHRFLRQPMTTLGA